MELYPQYIHRQLDFELIRRQLRALCATPAAKQMVEALKPSAEAKDLEKQLVETDQLLALLLREERIAPVEYPELKVVLHRLQVKGHQLEEEHFADLRSGLSLHLHFYRWLEKKQEELSLLWEAFRDCPPQKEIIELIDDVIDERARVRDQASPELAKIRRSLQKARASADRVFNRVLKKYRDKELLADFSESVSENRRVLAIQAAYKGQVNGIFHGSSAKQSIVFIEPGETVEYNNLIAQYQEEEKTEIRRILQELTKKIAPFYPFIELVVGLLNHLDFVRAKALLAHREGCLLPEISPEPRLSLVKAFNPVLRHFNRERGQETEPLDLHLDREKRILVISGPNAGGKSLALKTVGLLQYMLQCGLLVPVDARSKMALFKNLMVDIGDEQSIENELSTYSSKLASMRHFLQRADAESLLLIDEFGSGSDPDLGSALAQVFLERLNSFQCFGIFTTHFNAIKALAANLPGVENGAMLFNRKTFAPTYRLQTGNPGSSFTFEVAQRSGISPTVIEEARSKVSQNTLEINRLLGQIQDDKIRLEKIRRDQKEELAKLKGLQNEQRQKIAGLEDKLRRQSQVNEKNDRLLYWGQRFQKLLESWMEQKSQKDKKAVVARFIAMLNQRAGEVEQSEQKSHTKVSAAHQRKLDKYTSVAVKKGDSVRVLESGLTGTILEQQGDKYRIALGGNLSTLMERKRFVPAEAPVGAKPQKKRRKKRFGGKKSTSASKAKEKQDSKKKAANSKSKNAPSKSPSGQSSKKPGENKKD